jgi:hypothetical protein
VHEPFAQMVERRARRSRLYGAIFLYFLLVTIVGVAFLFFFAAHISTVDIDPSTSNTPSISQYQFIASAAITRLSSIIMAVFIIQICIQFARYYFRLADYMDTRADVLRLSKGNIEHIQTLMQALSPNFDFGKMPTPIPAKIWDVLQETVKRYLRGKPDYHVERAAMKAPAIADRSFCTARPGYESRPYGGPACQVALLLGAAGPGYG